jgi:hypothetical protein
MGMVTFSILLLLQIPHAKQNFHVNFCCRSNGSGGSDTCHYSTASERIVISFVSTISFGTVCLSTRQISGFGGIRFLHVKGFDLQSFKAFRKLSLNLFIQATKTISILFNKFRQLYLRLAFAIDDTAKTTCSEVGLQTIWHHYYL